jgi:hypothetical protein
MIDEYEYYGQRAQAFDVAPNRMGARRSGSFLHAAFRLNHHYRNVSMRSLTRDIDGITGLNFRRKTA